MNRSAQASIRRYGAAILRSQGMQSMRAYKQHGTTSIFAHCVNVACMSVRIANRLHIRVDERAMVRGALLHDYFLYDWHNSRGEHRWHGFRHAGWALRNASRDFELGDVERDVIKKHMFPLNPALPRYRETVIVSLADKLCAVGETLAAPRRRMRRLLNGLLGGGCAQG